MTEGGSAGDRGPAVAKRIDVRDVACPLTWVRTRVALEQIGAGQALEVLLLAGEAVQSVPRTAEEEGHEVALCEPWPDAGARAWRVLLVKGASRPRGGLLP